MRSFRRYSDLKKTWVKLTPPPVLVGLTRVVSRGSRGRPKPKIIGWLWCLEPQEAQLGGFQTFECIRTCQVKKKISGGSRGRIGVRIGVVFFSRGRFFLTF